MSAPPPTDILPGDQLDLAVDVKNGKPGETVTFTVAAGAGKDVVTTLKGNVANEEDKAKAADVAKQAAPDYTIANEIGVRPPQAANAGAVASNVDSAIVAFRRTGPPPAFRRLKQVVEAAFAHRRKRLANSLELAGLAARPRAEAAIAELGKPSTVRAEELTPAEFLRLEEALR